MANMTDDMEIRQMINLQIKNLTREFLEEIGSISKNQLIT